MERLFHQDECDKEIEQLMIPESSIIYNKKEHSLKVQDQLGNTLDKIVLPIQISFDQHTEKTFPIKNGYLIIVIQSSYAAIGYGEDDIIFDHKVFSSYMVRQKQGKSQVKHLKTKGKSKAGSRVRLSSTDSFFENINDFLVEIEDNHIVNRIALSCPKILLSHFFKKRPRTPFLKEDNRIISIPLDLPKPNAANLKKLHEWLICGKHIVER